MKAVSGTRAEWVARDAYYWGIGHAPGFLLTSYIRRGRDYDRFTIRAAGRALASGGSAIDIGANAGQLLRHFTRLSPGGGHWAFEPIPRLADRLRAKFPAVHVEEVALADYEGSARFRFLPGEPACSSLLTRPRFEAGQQVTVLDVKVRCLDDCLPPSLPVAFIKIDVEGAEAAVLRGAARTLRAWSPVVVFECAPAGLADCIAVLQDAGLRTCALDSYPAGLRDDPQEVMSRALERGDYYFAAAAA